MLFRIVKSLAPSSLITSRLVTFGLVTFGRIISQPRFPDHWPTSTAAIILVLIIPGSTIPLVVSQALAHGRRPALAIVAGVALGDLLAMTNSLLSLGALALASSTLFTTLKWCGALYLCWPGMRMILGQPGVTNDCGHAHSVRVSDLS